MKHIKSLAAVIAVAFLIGCAGQSRVTYNTLASVESATTGAFDSYLALVVSGQVRTNDVPVVSRDYNLFKISWSAAVALAQWNTNAIAIPQVTDASATVLADIVNAKNGKGTP